jgi:hypothetical protein
MSKHRERLKRLKQAIAPNTVTFVMADGSERRLKFFPPGKQFDPSDPPTDDRYLPYLLTRIMRGDRDGAAGVMAESVSSDMAARGLGRLDQLARCIAKGPVRTTERIQADMEKNRQEQMARYGIRIPTAEAAQ